MLGEFIDPKRALQLAQSSAQSSADSRQDWLGLGRDDFAANYNRRPFLVRHRLAEHPLFRRAEIFDLCRRHPRDSVMLRTGQVPITEDFARSFERFGAGFELEDALANFEARRAYILVNNPERDALYRPTIEALLGEIAHHTAAIDPGITWYSTYLFISSQHSVTPYHMDREMNFLFQIFGAKQVQLWDPRDNEVMSDAERDRLLAFTSGLRPSYKASIADKAQRFELSPGLGVHHPFIAPHVVSTTSDFSISFALTYRTERTNTWADAHRLNHKLRQIGWQPHPVGIEERQDRNKATLIRTVNRAKAAPRSIRGLLGRH